MTDPPSYPGTGSAGDDAGGTAASGPASRRPRWKTAAIWAIVIALLLMMIVLHLTGVVGAGTNG